MDYSGILVDDEELQGGFIYFYIPTELRLWSIFFGFTALLTVWLIKASWNIAVFDL